MVEREESKFPGVTEPTHDWEVGREVMERTVAEGSHAALRRTYWRGGTEAEVCHGTTMK